MVRDIKKYLNITDHMFSGEIWDMVKQERENGNIKAKIAFVAYYVDAFCIFIMFILIGITNI